MIQAARDLARRLEYAIAFQTGDAGALPFGREVFEGIIFGFNGLMQIPSAAARCRVLTEIYQALKPGGYFIFTTHDCSSPLHEAFRDAELDRLQTQHGWEPPEPGDILADTPYGSVYLHIPMVEQTRAALTQTGFRIASTALRSAIAEETPQVYAFADECRFWIAQRL